MITKNKSEKSRDMCKSRYLICLFATCEDVKFIWLYLLNLFIKIFFLINQIIIEIDIHIKLIE
jgi:hypothetical protein